MVLIMAVLLPGIILIARWCVVQDSSGSLPFHPLRLSVFAVRPYFFTNST